MSLRERVALVTLGTVGVTAALVGAVSLAIGAGTGEIALQAVAAAVALGVAAGLARALLLGPFEREIEALVGWIRRPSDTPSHRIDPELSHVVDALRAQLVDLRTELERVRHDARTAEDALDTSPFGIAIADAEGRMTYANPTFRRTFRLRGEPVGRRPIEVVPVVEVHEAIEAALGQHGPVEKRFVTASQDFVARAHPLPGDRTILRLEDVTREREAERSRTDFVANVSHELRTPITAIMGYLEALLQDADRLPPDLVQLLETVDRNAKRLRDLFEDLLRLHRIEARRRELPLERHPLRPLLEEACGPVIDRSRMRKQEFALDCPPDLLGYVNPEALSAIVANLAGNASAYTTEGGHVQVRAIAGPRGLATRIEVQDDGIGIAERHHERIFERFYRVDEARSRRVGGTGLGLAIVKHYALASQCSVTLRSQEGAGSTFVVHLPEP